MRIRNQIGKTRWRKSPRPGRLKNDRFIVQVESLVIIGICAIHVFSASNYHGSDGSAVKVLQALWFVYVFVIVFLSCRITSCCYNTINTSGVVSGVAAVTGLCLGTHWAGRSLAPRPGLCNRRSPGNGVGRCKRYCKFRLRHPWHATRSAYLMDFHRFPEYVQFQYMKRSVASLRWIHLPGSWRTLTYIVGEIWRDMMRLETMGQVQAIAQTYICKSYIQYIQSIFNSWQCSHYSHQGPEQFHFKWGVLKNWYLPCQHPTIS